MFVICKGFWCGKIQHCTPVCLRCLQVNNGKHNWVSFLFRFTYVGENSVVQLSVFDYIQHYNKHSSRRTPLLTSAALEPLFSTAGQTLCTLSYNKHDAFLKRQTEEMLLVLLNEKVLSIVKSRLSTWASTRH